MYYRVRKQTFSLYEMPKIPCTTGQSCNTHWYCTPGAPLVFLPSRRRVGGISLSFITSLRAYILQRQFRILQQHEILYIAKTNGYSKGIRHNVRPDAKYVGCLTISVYIERAKFGCGDGHSKVTEVWVITLRCEYR